MAKHLLTKLAVISLSVVSVLMSFFYTVHADIAPDPVRQAVNYGPLVLVFAVVAAALVLIKKFFGKK